MTRQVLLLIAGIQSVIIVFLLCVIIFSCRGKPVEHPEEQIVIEELVPEETETTPEQQIVQTPEENSAARVSHQVQRPLSSMSGLNRIQGRVSASEINPANYNNPDPEILKQMGVDQYLVSYFTGERFYRNADYDRALGEYTISINNNKDFIESFISRGNTYMKKREYRRAIEDFSQAIRLNGSRAEL